MSEEIYDQVVDAVAVVYGVDVERIGPSAAFADLGGDSLDRLELGMVLESFWRIEIEDADMQGIDTVADVVAMIEKKVNG